MTGKHLAQLLSTIVLTLMPTGSLLAQGPLPDAPIAPAVQPISSIFTPSPLNTDRHKFWDNDNRVLFATALALDGADFAVTRANLQSGGRELNPLVRMFGRSTAGLAANFASEGAGTVLLSYFFHKTGHHRLERVVSFVNIGGSAGAVAYGLSHR
jgi:hypothetical protein